MMLPMPERYSSETDHVASSVIKWLWSNDQWWYRLLLGLIKERVSPREHWFHRIRAYLGMADASPLQRCNWARWLISAGVLGLALVLLFYRLGDGSLHDWDEAIYA